MFHGMLLQREGKFERQEKCEKTILSNDHFLQSFALASFLKLSRLQKFYEITTDGFID